MTVSFCTDEYVPSVFVTALRSNGYVVETANGVLAREPTIGSSWSTAAKRHVFVRHEKKDFSGKLADSVDHAGIVIYTDPSFLRSVSPGWQTDPVTV